jgi:hypothetical protein
MLGRVAKNRVLPALKRFSDGSYLSQIEPAPQTQKAMSDVPTEPLTVRVIDYRLPGVEGAEPTGRSHFFVMISGPA